ncbi:MAG: LVIVD repeat-containing protein [Candidatus Glassbacteria bacterium]
MYTLQIDIATGDSLLYVADGEEGLQVFSASDPTGPIIIGHVSTIHYTNAVDHRGEYAYIGDWDGGLRIISVADPANPEQAGMYDTPGYVRDIDVSGSYVCVADDKEGFKVISIVSVSDPGNPVEVGFIELSEGSSIYGMVIDHSYAYSTWSYK